MRGALGDPETDTCSRSGPTPRSTSPTPPPWPILTRAPRGLNLIGADIVCYCPLYDNAAQTIAMAASHPRLPFATLVAERLIAGG